MMFHTKPSTDEDALESSYVKPFDAVSTDLSRGCDERKSIDSGVMYQFKVNGSESLYWPEELPVYNPVYWAGKLSEKGAEDMVGATASHADKLIEAMPGFDVPPGLEVLTPIEPVGVFSHLVIGPG